MFDKFKNWGTKKLLENQLKNVPKEQQELIMTMFEKDPKLMEKIAKEMKAEMDAGSTQIQAAMKVMPKYQTQMQGLLGDKMPVRGAGAGKGFNPNGSIRK